ncbi:MAG TPA: sigma-70 family RNA polymerase sigma factor [Acidimicrobiales bacterium]|nr:sigma-70 family RNA polymerase sigma factor [Acidimicrobiales bacterium]
MVATLIRTTGDWDLAEECAQDAFAQAIEAWARDGVPRSPGAWLTTVARNRALDRIRRDQTRAAKYKEIAVTTDDEPAEQPLIADDRLRLIFTCCHPALPIEGRVALTLRTLAGLSTAEIARAFLVPEPTMAKRLVRAKAKIQHAGIPYRVPPPELLPERVEGVLGVLYLLFNEGYNATSGDDHVRVALCDEAIRLAGALADLMADEPEAAGLLALMELHHARRAGRVDAHGDLLPLEEQDRSTWDLDAIRRAVARLESAERRGARGPYQLQAAIAACHAIAPVAAATDWPRIVALYDQLAGMVPTPFVALNRAVAVGMAFGPEAALPLLDALAGELESFHLFHATRGDMLRRLGDRDAAAQAFTEAARLAPTEVQRRYLERRSHEV